MKNVVLLEMSSKLYEIVSENSENLITYIHLLFQHSKVAALEVLQGDVKYISKETFLKTYYFIL